MKKKLAGIIWLAVLTFGFSGCGDYGKEGMAAAVSGPAEETERRGELNELSLFAEEAIQQKADERTEETGIRDLDEAYEVILSSCSKEFIGEHPVDEAFLGWVQAVYGEEIVIRLAQELESVAADTDIWYELTGNTIHVLWLMYCKESGLKQCELDNVYWKDCASDTQVVLDFTGDINFDENWCTMKHLDAQPNGIYDCFSEELLEEMQSADIMMLNNEFTYSDRGEPLAGKDYTFRAAPERVKLLEAFGTDIVGLANNHVWDYGEEALLDTMEILEQEEIPYVGAGRNLDEAKKIVYFVANGRKIAITAATQIERSLNYTKEATEDVAGVLKTLEPDKYLEVLREAKKNSDIVIAFVHWGTEGSSSYGADQEKLAEEFVEAGADVIIGGHTHCLQGMTYISGAPVIYSLGNFWFTQSAIDTGMSQVIINKDGSIDFRFIPCIQKNIRTELVTDQDAKERIFNYMESISKQIGIDKDGYVSDLTKGQ